MHGPSAAYRTTMAGIWVVAFSFLFIQGAKIGTVLISYAPDTSMIVCGMVLALSGLGAYAAMMEVHRIFYPRD